MEKNYYDILQINKNASPEIIEKAYKTLAKKYHPDLQEEKNKIQAEEILKEINEAYETLSNPEKKQIYDKFLADKEEAFTSQQIPHQEQATYQQQQYQSQQSKEQIAYQQQLEHEQQMAYQQELAYQQQLQREQELAYQQQLQQAREKAYHDAYIQDLKNRGYRIHYKKTFKDYIRGIISIIIVIFVLFLLWQIPFVKNYFINLYEENEIIHSAVDLIFSFF